MCRLLVSPDQPRPSSIPSPSLHAASARLLVRLFCSRILLDRCSDPLSSWCRCTHMFSTALTRTASFLLLLPHGSSLTFLAMAMATLQAQARFASQADKKDAKEREGQRGKNNEMGEKKQGEKRSPRWSRRRERNKGQVAVLANASTKVHLPHHYSQNVQQHYLYRFYNDSRCMPRLALPSTVSLTRPRAGETERKDNDGCANEIGCVGHAETP